MKDEVILDIARQAGLVLPDSVILAFAQSLLMRYCLEALHAELEARDRTGIYPSEFES